MKTNIKYFIFCVLFLNLAFSQEGITKVEKKIEQKDSQNIVKPMKKKNMKKINEVQVEKEKLRKEFETEKLAIHQYYTKEINRLKKKRKTEIIKLKDEYKKKRQALKK